MINGRAIGIAAFLALAGLFLVVESGRRVAYLYSDNSTFIRVCIFLLVFLIFVYFSLARRWGNKFSRLGPAAKRMNKRSRMMLGCKVLVAQAVMAGLIAWMAVFVSAFGARLVPSEHFMGSYKVVGADLRGSRMISVSLETELGKGAVLRVARTRSLEGIGPGDHMCIFGEKSLLGVSVSKVMQSPCTAL